jgi:hypothetical protein
MISRAWIMVAVGLSVPVSGIAQVGTVLRGRIEDATTRQPVEGARVFSADSASVAVTDSLGNFDLPAVDTGPWVLLTDRLGYATQTFELAGEPASSRFVLLLEPSPIMIDALTVEAEAALVTLQRNLRSRRNAYPHAMRALDREWIDRFGPTGGSALDLVLQAAPRFFPCTREPSQLCRRGRFVTFRNPYPEDQILVCIDGVRAFAALSELSSLHVGSVALAEVYAQSQVRVYSADYLLYRARRGWTSVEPIQQMIPSCS